jgi:hypothetical protein
VLRDAIDRCAQVKGVTPEAVSALRKSADSLGAAEKSGEPAEPIGALRQLIGQGADLVVQLPKWIPAKSAAALATAFDGVARRTPVPEMRDGSYADLCRMALLADALARIDKLKLTSKEARSMRAVGAALADAVAEGSTDSDDALAALRRGLLLVEQYDGARWNENHRVVREVRPLWREVEVQGRRTREELIEVLSRLTPKMPALSDPGVLGGMSALGQTMEDGRRLCIISAWLAGDARPGETGPAIWAGNLPKEADGRVREPVTQREDRLRRLAGVKLLALGQKAHVPDTHAEAVGEMEALADGLAAWMPIAGEDDLRAAVASPDSPVGVRWSELTGGAAADIAHAVEQARGEFLASWADVKERAAPGAAPPESAPDTGRIDVLRRLVQAAADGALVLEMADPAGRCSAKAWPGFELSGEAYASALAALKADLSRAGGAVISGTPEGVTEAVRSMEKAAEIIAMLARLERAARVRAKGSAAMLDELANPPPVLPTLGEELTPGVWLLQEQGSIALVCRCLEEYAEATKEADKAKATQLLNRAVAEAERVAPSIK